MRNRNWLYDDTGLSKKSFIGSLLVFDGIALVVLLLILDQSKILEAIIKTTLLTILAGVGGFMLWIGIYLLVDTFLGD